MYGILFDQRKSRKTHAKVSLSLATLGRYNHSSMTSRRTTASLKTAEKSGRSANPAKGKSAVGQKQSTPIARPNFAASGKIIRDPLHDLIRVDQFAYGLLQTPAFQRLRKIRQLGLAMLVYPGAEHSRFVHSLGAYHLARRVVRALLDLDRGLFSLDEQQAIQLAALCHDIGHGPFSHLFERVTGEFISKDAADHETWTRKIIREDDRVVAALEAAGDKVPGIVFDIINKTYKKTYATDIVSSQLDVDRFDYLMRDSFMTGVKYGDLDLNWLLRTLQIGTTSKDGKQIKTLALDGRRGLSSVESYILGRHYMYIHVYYHKTIQAAESMLKNVLKLAIQETGKGTLKNSHPFFETLSKGKVPSLANYLSLNDFNIFCMLESWAATHKGALGDLSKRLVERDIFGCVTIPEKLTHEKRLDKDKKTRTLLRSKKLDPDSYLIVQEPSDRAFKDLYFHIQGGSEKKHQEIYYVDATGDTKPLSTADSFIKQLRFAETRIYVPKEVFNAVHDIWLK